MGVLGEIVRQIEQVEQIPLHLHTPYQILQRAFTSVLLSALLLTACENDDTFHPTSTPTTAVSTSTPDACSRDQVLAEVDTLLTGADYEAHYLTINGQMTLSIWFVEPEIDPEVAIEQLEEHSRIAFLRGAMMAHQIVQEIPCTRQVFKNINPMIVDRRVLCP